MNSVKSYNYQICLGYFSTRAILLFRDMYLEIQRQTVTQFLGDFPVKKRLNYWFQLDGPQTHSYDVNILNYREFLKIGGLVPMTLDGGLHARLTLHLWTFFVGSQK